MTFSRCSGSSPSSDCVRGRSSVRALAGPFVDPHDPAAGELALGLQEHRALRLQDVERVRPELQPQDVAFVGQQVVADVQPRHRLQVRADDAIDDERADRGGVVAAVLEVVQRRGADREPRLVAVVPLGDARVEVPAVVVEPRGVGDAPDVVERLVLELAEADDDVGDLDAGVVDVVLHFDRRAAEAQHPHQRVAERGIPQVADVRGLVRVDRRVLDDGLLRRGRAPASTSPRERAASEERGRSRYRFR